MYQSFQRLFVEKRFCLDEDGPRSETRLPLTAIVNTAIVSDTHTLSLSLSEQEDHSYLQQAVHTKRKLMGDARIRAPPASESQQR